MFVYYMAHPHMNYLKTLIRLPWQYLTRTYKHIIEKYILHENYTFTQKIHEFCDFKLSSAGEVKIFNISHIHDIFLHNVSINF